MRDATPTETDALTKRRWIERTPLWLRRAAGASLFAGGLLTVTLLFDAFVLDVFLQGDAQSPTTLLLLWLDELLAVFVGVALFIAWQRQKKLGRRATLMQALLNPKPKAFGASASLDLICDAAIYVDKESIIREVSDSAASFFGYAPEDMLGRKNHDVVLQPESKNHRNEKWAALNKEKKTLTFEALRAGSDQIPKLFSVTVIPVLTAFGAIDGFWILYRAIPDELAQQNQRVLNDSVWEQLEEVIVINDLNGTVVSANRAVESFFQRSREEIVGRHIRDMVSDTLIFDEFQARIKKGLEEEGQWREVVEVIWKSRKPTWASFVVKPLCDLDGNIIGHINTFIDVTDQRMIEAKRGAAERRYRMLFESNWDGVVIGRSRGPGKDPEILDANDTYLAMVGYSLDELLALESQVTTPDEWRAYEREHILPKALKDGVTPIFEKELISKDGIRVPVSCRYWRTEDPHTKDRLVVGFYRDISAEKAASESQERQAIALSQAQDAVIIQEVSGRILETNRAAQELFGRDATAFENMYRAEFLHPDFDREKFSHDWALAMHHDGAWFGDLEVKGSDGSKRILDASSTALKDQLDRIIAVVDVYRDVTESRAREARLRLYEEVWSQVQDGVAVYDMQGNVLDANSAALRIYGMDSRPKRLSAAENQLADPSQANAIIADMLHSIETEGEWTAELDIKHPDGAVRRVEQRTVAYRDADGRVIGSIGLSRDVTERRQADSKLRLYAQIWEQVRDGLSVVDLDGKILETNPAAREIFGAVKNPKNQIAYERVADRYAAAEMKTEIETAIAEKGEWFGEFDVTTDDGKLRRVQQRSVPFRDDSGHVVGRIGLSRDITGQKEAERRMRLFEAVWDQVSEGVTLVDNDGKIIDLNPAAANMFEKSKDSLIGSDSYKRVRGNGDADSLHNQIKTQVAKSGRWSGEMPTVNEAGEPRLIDHTVVPLRDDTGEIIGRIGVSRDVTDERSNRDLLNRQAQALEQVSDPIFMTDVVGKVLFCNKAAENLLGKSREEVFALEPFELYSTKNSYKTNLEARDRQIAETGIYTGTYSLMRRDGLRWVEFTKTPIRNGAGEITGFIAVHRDQTERQEAERELKRQAAALDQVLDAVYMSDREGHIIYANEAALRLAGCSLEELLSMDPNDLYTSEGGYKKHVADRDRALKEKGVFEAEYEFEAPYGHAIIEYSSSPIRDTDGEVMGYISVNRDVTLRRRAEQSLMRQAIVMDQIGDAVTVFDLNGIIVDCNQKTPELFHMSREQLIGQPSDFAALEKEAFAKQRLEWRTAVLAGSTWTGEVQMRTSTGREFTLETTVAPLTNSGGELTHFTAVSRDVTARKAEEAVRRRHETIWQQMGEAIMLVGPDESILDCNPSAASLTGYAQDDLLSMKLGDLDPDPEKNTQFRQQKYEMADSEGRWEGQGEILTKAGENKIIDAVYVPLIGGEGSITSHILVFRDITDRQATEAQLRQAQKMEAVGRLTGGIAHDFNNLLAVIIGNLELGIDYYDKLDDLRTASKKALTAAHKGAALTQQLLDYARTREHTPEVIELNAMVTSMSDLIKGSIGDPVELILELDADNCLISVDPNQLENAIINLAINARDAMPEGGQLTFRTVVKKATAPKGRKSKSKSSPPTICLEIIDTGSGIPEELVSQIFDPFFTTKDVGKGSGLGLSMVFGFMQQAGGYVSVDSKPGKGTRFTLAFPQTDREPTPAVQTDERDISVKGDGRTVLLVEDDPTVRAVTSSQLEQLGFSVEEAVDGADARAALLDIENCSLLITDIGLPGGETGIDLARDIHTSHPTVPILLMTGFTEDEVLDALPEDARFNVIQKPFQKSTLARTLKFTMD